MPAMLPPDYHGGRHDGSVHYVDLREESFKSWEYAVTDELVYLVNPFNVLGNAGLIPSEIYLKGDAWIEMHFLLKGDGSHGYTAIIESLSLDKSGFVRGQVSKSDIHCTAIRRDPPMFVEITHLVKPPQRVCFKGIPSMVRLKRFDLTNSPIRDSFGKVMEPLSCFGIPNLHDWKLRPFWEACQPGQTPDQLVKRGSHAVKNVADDQRNLRGNVLELKVNDMQSPFKVIFNGKSVGFRENKVADFQLQVMKMFLRPTHLQIGIFHCDTPVQEGQESVAGLHT
jgi:hypothetical protein